MKKFVGLIHEQKEKESSKKTYILTNGSSFQYPNCIDRGPVMAILAQ